MKIQTGIRLSPEQKEFLASCKGKKIDGFEIMSQSHAIKIALDLLEQKINQQKSVLAFNVFQCQICQGPVDRYEEHLFKCRQCGSFGNATTGMMNRNFKL